MTTIAYAARIRFADTTAPLAKAVINARFAAIVADNFATVTIDADDHEFEHTCELCGQGADETFTRLDEDGDEVEACEACVDTLHLGYVAD